jgi:hypothetical protein
MKKLNTYLTGILIGMIAEYSLRIEFGYMQGFILLLLIIKMIIDINIKTT